MYWRGVGRRRERRVSAENPPAFEHYKKSPQVKWGKRIAATAVIATAVMAPFTALTLVTPLAIYIARRYFLAFQLKSAEIKFPTGKAAAAAPAAQPKSMIPTQSAAPGLGIGLGATQSPSLAGAGMGGPQVGGPALSGVGGNLGGAGGASGGMGI